MFFPLEKIVALLITYKYVVIFPIAVVEGPVVSIVSGSLVSQGYLNLFLVFFIIVIADLVGDTLYYCIGRYGGIYFIEKWNRIFNIQTKKLISLEDTFATHGPKLLLVGKMQGLGSIVLMAAGVAQYPYGPFMWYNTLATLIKSAALLAIGYIFYDQFAAADSLVVKIGLSISFLFIVGMSWYIFKKARSS